MKENQPSATALRVAMRRASHQFLDDRKVFDDSLTLRLISGGSASALEAELRQFEATSLTL